MQPPTLKACGAIHRGPPTPSRHTRVSAMHPPCRALMRSRLGMRIRTHDAPLAMISTISLDPLIVTRAPEAATKHITCPGLMVSESICLRRNGAFSMMLSCLQMHRESIILSWSGKRPARALRTLLSWVHEGVPPPSWSEGSCAIGAFSNMCIFAPVVGCL